MRAAEPGIEAVHVAKDVGGADSDEVDEAVDERHVRLRRKRSAKSHRRSPENAPLKIWMILSCQNIAKGRMRPWRMTCPTVLVPDLSSYTVCTLSESGARLSSFLSA